MCASVVPDEVCSHGDVLVGGCEERRGGCERRM